MYKKKYDGSYESDDGHSYNSRGAAELADWRHRKWREYRENSEKNANSSGGSSDNELLEQSAHDLMSLGSNFGLMGMFFIATASLIVIAFMVAAVFSLFEALYWSWLGYAVAFYAAGLVPNVISLIFEEKISEKAGRIARRSVDFIFIIGVIVAVYNYV